MANNITFDNFSYLNAKRCREVYGISAENQSLEQWGLKIAGEAGELAQEISRKIDGMSLVLENGKESGEEQILDECADVVTYCDLLCSHFGVSLSDVLARKFNAVSDRRGSTIKISI